MTHAFPEADRPPPRMKIFACAVFACVLTALVGLLLATSSAKHTQVVRAATTAPSGTAPAYTADGKLLFPYKYREWIYLTTGMDMSYTPMSGMSGQSTFDNVFVNPEAYRSFLQTGTWPDKTIILIEARGAQTRGSINKSGHFQGSAIEALEVHVKDDARTPGAWAFYSFNSENPAEKIPTTADCYSCHQQHAAVATTFVQFYPTLLPIAKAKNTLSAEFLKDEAEHQKPEH